MAKVEIVNAVTRKCSSSGCTGSDFAPHKCQHFRLGCRCADEIHYNTDEEDDDCNGNDEEDDDNEMDRESRGADGQRDELDESGAARCVTCQILLCEGCTNDASCEYCGGAMCKSDARTYLLANAETQRIARDARERNECPDCDISVGYASCYM